MEIWGGGWVGGGGSILAPLLDDVKSCHGYEVALYLADQYWYIPISALAGPTGPNNTSQVPFTGRPK